MTIRQNDVRIGADETVHFVIQKKDELPVDEIRKKIFYKIGFFIKFSRKYPDSVIRFNIKKSNELCQKTL